MEDKRLKAVTMLDWALENTSISAEDFARYIIRDHLNSDMALESITNFLEIEEGIDLSEFTDDENVTSDDEYLLKKSGEGRDYDIDPYFFDDLENDDV